MAIIFKDEGQANPNWAASAADVKTLGSRASRRAVNKELARVGLLLRRREAPFVRELVQIALANNRATFGSGNQ